MESATDGVDTKVKVVEDGDDGETFDASDFFLGGSSIDGFLAPESSLSGRKPAIHSRVTIAACLPSKSTADYIRHGEMPAGSTACDSFDGQQDTTSAAWSSEFGDFVALGSIRLERAHDPGDTRWCMVGPHKATAHPHALLALGEKRDWIRTELVEHHSDERFAFLRVCALPEDVNRSNRGSVKNLRKVLKLLAEYIDTSPEVWNGTYDPASCVRSYAYRAIPERSSLFYIFNTLSSPSASVNDAGPILHNQQAMYDVFNTDIAGLKTELYAYQKRSIAAMLQKEVHPSKANDPRKPQFQDLDGKQFYFDIQEGVLLHNAHLYSECQGGILAETMGYGKTLICIALMLATRGHYPNIPEGRISTELAQYDKHKATPSLMDLAARKIKQSGIPWKMFFAEFEHGGDHFDKCLATLGRYHGEYEEPIFHATTPNRKIKKREDFRTLRLAPTTLVIVPPNLLVQWQEEIRKHTMVDALDVLVLDATVKEVPSWRTLIKYDIILITKARFEQEYRDDDLHQGKLFRGQEKFRSQLTELRWLRVICDEGHGFAGSSYRTHAMAMLDKMSIERKWIVSGTPSHSLHGVEVDLASKQTGRKDKNSRTKSIEQALASRRTQDTVAEEIKDMERLRAIVERFLKVQPWANQKGVDHADWKKYLHPFDAAGQRRFAPALQAILQSLIVRHRIEDVDTDLCLPPLHNTTIYLEPSYYDKLSMNLFRMVLTSNAVTSERLDEDYMFHPKNRKSLDELITNLRRSSFHWVGFTEHDITESMRVSNKYLDEHLDTIIDEDGALLTESIMNADRALNDTGWKAFSFYHEMGVYVKGFPEDSAEPWALDGANSDLLLLGTVQAREAQQHVLKRVGSDDPSAGLTGAGLRAMFAAKERATEAKNERDNARPATGGKHAAAGTMEEPKIKNQSASSSPIRPRHKLKDSELQVVPQKRSFSNSSTALSSDLKQTTIAGFTSSKLNYLCSRVLSLQHDEKIIVFYDSNNIAFWIAEALELLSVKFLIYANTLSVRQRAAYLATFNQSPIFRVLLMDLKQASHGLHVAAASRIFIVSPVWQPDIEAQAIKRAHRIGQTRPVYVETLVLKGTIEEKILQRRREMSNAELVKAEKSLLDDGTMTGIIRTDGFLKIHEGEKEEMMQNLLAEPVPLFDRPGVSEDYAGDQIIGLDDYQHGKKRRKATIKKQDKWKAKAVTFDGNAPLTPPATPGSTLPAVPSSIFGTGSSSSIVKPKKSVQIVVETPCASGPGGGADFSVG